MTRVRDIGAAVWDFVAGDDWVTAGGVVVALGVTAATKAWWIMPLAVVALLGFYFWRVVRDRE